MKQQEQKKNLNILKTVIKNRNKYSNQMQL